MKINLKLSPESLNDAIERLTEYQNRVKNAGDDISKKLAKDGVQFAKSNAIFMSAYDSGELVNGIIDEHQENKSFVKSTAAHSAYVEMGTGIRGQQNPNPNKYASGWQYDVNEHGESGWWYMGDDGKYHWTKGMPHRPFMYNAAQQIREEISEVAKQILDGKGDAD